jgi:hypothetical protein
MPQEGQAILKNGAGNMDDEYSYLSERSYPNGFCLQPYLRIEFPKDGSFMSHK